MSSGFRDPGRSIRYEQSSDVLAQEKALISLVVELAREIWSLEQAVERADLSNMPFNNELIAGVTKLSDSLEFGHIEVADLTGQIHDAGFKYNVAHIEDGNGELFVLETLIPAVRISGQQVAPATVILGRQETQQ